MRMASLNWIVRTLCLAAGLGFWFESRAGEQDDAKLVEVSGSESVFIPSRTALAVGIGIRPRLLYGQESFYQENWSLSAAAHWQCLIVEKCELVGRIWYQISLRMPENNGALSVSRSEQDLGLDFGFESRSLFLSGIAFGLVNSERKYSLKVEESIANKSGSQGFSEALRWPTARVWLGVPLWSEKFDLLLSVNRVFSEEAELEKQTYATELRFSF